MDDLKKNNEWTYGYKGVYFRDNDTFYDETGQAHRMVSPSGKAFDAREIGQPGNIGKGLNTYVKNRPVRWKTFGKDKYGRKLSAIQILSKDGWMNADSLANLDNPVVFGFKGDTTERQQKLSEENPYGDKTQPWQWRKYHTEKYGDNIGIPKSLIDTTKWGDPELLRKTLLKAILNKMR